jgi:hypothetical protein
MEDGMGKSSAQNLIEAALARAIEHLAGNRDRGLPEYLDTHVTRFANTLTQMRDSLQREDAERVTDRYMCHVVADAWPFDSELGKMVCDAEAAYFQQTEASG